jgi:tRNA-dihydrouridine synthase B
MEIMLKIGHLEFDFPVVQAALSGYSDAPMRIIARRYGAPYALHEVILDKSIAISEKGRRRLLKPLDPADHPVAGQLMGAEPDLFAEAARVLVEEGYDVIDINFGCPVKKVLGRHRGGYLLSDPDTAIEIVRRVREVVPEKIPLSVKMRRGMDLSLESERKFFKIFDAAFELGACAITVHGRTVVQKYRGPSDWNFLKRVKQYAGDRTILGSGDLYNADDIRRMLIETGVDGVTVARGCIGNPWIFADCRALFAGQPLPEPPSVAEQGQVIREHFELALRLHGTDRAARIMRKFGIRYADLHPHPKAVRMAFVAASDPQAWFDVLDRWYDPSENWGPGRRRRDPGEMFNQDPTLSCGAG